MPMHDWTRVDAGIYHDFHHEWISEISRGLNRGLLPITLYALPEQIAAGFGPDELTLPERTSGFDAGPGATAQKVLPKTKHTAAQTPGLRQRRPNRIVVRHGSDDRIVAMIELLHEATRSRSRRFGPLSERPRTYSISGSIWSFLIRFPLARGIPTAFMPRSGRITPVSPSRFLLKNHSPSSRTNRVTRSGLT